MPTIKILGKILLFLVIGYLWFLWTVSTDPETNSMPRIIGLFCGLLILLFLLNIDKWNKEREWRRRLENAVLNSISNKDEADLDKLEKVYLEKYGRKFDK